MLDYLLENQRHQEDSSRLLSNVIEWVSEVTLSCPTLKTPWTVAHQAPPSMGFFRQEYWSGLPFPPPVDLPNPGIKPMSPALQADSLLSEPSGKSGESRGQRNLARCSRWGRKESWQLSYNTHTHTHTHTQKNNRFGSWFDDPIWFMVKSPFFDVNYLLARALHPFRNDLS